MTCQCIDTLLDQFGSYNIFVVVVDNASKNSSGKQLRDYYKSQTKVEIVLNSENLGFAKGNNIGLQYLIEKFDPDYTIIMNNDVIIEQDEFLSKINDIYLEKAFDILGPDIYCPISNTHQNPVSENSEFDFYSLMKKMKYLQRLNNYFDFLYPLDKIKGTIMYHCKKLYTHTAKKELYKDPHEEVLLHGACYIFSSPFIKKRGYAFNPSTFLYFEEEILYFESVKESFSMIYSPQIVVKHLEDVSTNLAFKTDEIKTKMKVNSQLDSSKVLLDLYKEYARENGIVGNYKIGEINIESKNKKK